MNAEDAEKLRQIIGPFTIFSEAETRELFFPIRDTIFAMNQCISEDNEAIFADPSWVKVIIRGGVFQSNRSDWREIRETARDWLLLDTRDELQPLFDVLIDDGILDVIHLEPFSREEDQRATITRPTDAGVRCTSRLVMPNVIPTWHIIFDRTARWGVYGSFEEFGLLGGEPAFMERFIERSGGMELIRERADRFWQAEIDCNGYEANAVPHYYKLAGWDNPPCKRGT